jgi:uncharacterized membrane protein
MVPAVWEDVMAFCTGCGKEVPAGAAACPGCGQASAGAAVAAPMASSGGLTDNVAGALAYVTLIPAIVFLVMEPYNKNKFIRFHSFQCLFLHAALIVLWIALTLVAMVPVVGLILIPVWFVVWLGSIVLWVILVLKAYQGQKFKLPGIGDFAEQQANA